MSDQTMVEFNITAYEGIDVDLPNNQNGQYPDDHDGGNTNDDGVEAFTAFTAPLSPMLIYSGLGDKR
jgi:hypothetical protein